MFKMSKHPSFDVDCLPCKAKLLLRELELQLYSYRPDKRVIIIKVHLDNKILLT